MSDFFQDYLNFASEITDAPESFHLFVSYVLAATVIGRNVYFPFGDSKIFPNLWLVLIAPSSSFRKSTSLSIGAWLLRKVDPNLVYPAEFTQERLLEVLQNNPVGTFLFFEFKSMITQMNKDYNSGLRSFFVEIYDCPEIYQRTTKMSSFTLERPCPSILSATTLDWLINSASNKEDLQSGFFARFLFVPVTSKTKDLAIPPPANQDKKIVLINSLKELQKISGQMILSPEAKREFELFYKKHNTLNKSNEFAGIYSRLQIYTLKFAMIHSLVINKTLTIQDSSMREAINLINWLTAQLDSLLSEDISLSKFDANKKKIIKLIKDGKSTRSDLLNYSNLQKYDFDRVMETLVEGQILEISKENRQGSKKQVTVYKICIK